MTGIVLSRRFIEMGWPRLGKNCGGDRCVFSAGCTIVSYNGTHLYGWIVLNVRIDVATPLAATELRWNRHSASCSIELNRTGPTIIAVPSSNVCCRKKQRETCSANDSDLESGQRSSPQASGTIFWSSCSSLHRPPSRMSCHHKGPAACRDADTNKLDE